jgi:hypothetical protein
MEAEKLSLGGKEYGYVGAGPLRQDLFVMMHARHAGLVGAEILPDETPEEYAKRLLDMVLTSGRALLLLGGLLIPAGKRPEDWSEEMAYETAGALGSITDADEKRKVQVELLSVMLGFFENGLGSWIASARASAAAAEPEKSPPAAGGNGMDSSESSPVMIPSAENGSPGG